MNTEPQDKKSNKESNNAKSRIVGIVTRIVGIVAFLASLAAIASLYQQNTALDQQNTAMAEERARSATDIVMRTTQDSFRSTKDSIRATDEAIRAIEEAKDQATVVALLEDGRNANLTSIALGGKNVDLLSTQNAAFDEKLSTLAPQLPTVPISTNNPNPTPSSTRVLIVDTPVVVTEPSTKFGNVTATYSVQDYQTNSTQTVLGNGQQTGVDILSVVDNKWIFSIGFGGTDPILCTHPLTRTVPSTFTIKVSNDKLRFSVRPHNSGNSYIEFWVGESLIYKEEISDKRWYSKELDLPPGTEAVLLKHYATGWSWEYLYWSLVE